MPALPRNCYKTPHGFLFRIVVPEPLRAAIGKREIKKTLGKDYRQAVNQAHVLSLQADRRFGEVRSQQSRAMEADERLAAFIATPADRRLKAITEVTPELVAGLRGLWLSGLEADLAWRREGLDEDEYDSLQDNVTGMREEIGKALARGRADAFIPVVRSLLHGRGYELAVPAEQERQLTLDVLLAIQEGYDILQQRQEGRLVGPARTDAPPLPAAWEPAPAAGGAGLGWEELIAHWKADRRRALRTELEVETIVGALRAFLPQSRPGTLTALQITEWLRHERDTRGNSARTLEKKGTLVSALFSIACKDALLERNPFAGFDYERFAPKEGRAEAEGRMPFALEDLRRIFSPEGLFAVTKDAGGGGYHARIWIPLLALYSGARLDEIGSLLVANIHLEPVPHFSITRGKTQSSIRNVPLHPQLIELGFLDYVQALKAAGHALLWPYLRARSTKAHPSETLGRWFNRYLRQTLKLPKTKVFHSFRHTFKDLCRNALIHRDVHDALTGHAKREVSDGYGSGYSLEVRHSELKRIVLPLDIPRPAPFAVRQKASR